MTIHLPAGIDLPVPKDDNATMALLRSEGPLQEARRIFSSYSARIEQAGEQRRPSSIIEIRRMEFEAVAEIAAALGMFQATD
jgi:hypothetical protein